MQYGLVIALMITALTWGGWTLVDEPLPAGSPGPESEALADEVLAAIHYDAWRLTGVVEWTSLENESTSGIDSATGRGCSGTTIRYGSI